MDTQQSFKILEIDHSATLEEARQAYRDLVAVWHPDRYSHNPRLQKKALDKMKTVNAAFEIVSRFIAVNGSGEKSTPDIKPGPNHFAARDEKRTSGEKTKSAVWAETEARLAALAQAKKIADARKAAQEKEAARIAAAREKKLAAEKKARIEAEKLARAREKKAAEKAILEKKRERETAWKETEKKLRVLKRAKEKNEAGPAAGGDKSPEKKETRESVVWHIKQTAIGCTILLAALSTNAFQTMIHFNFASILIIIGSGFFAWWLIARFSRSDNSN